MATLDVKSEDIQAITSILAGYEKAIFPMLEGADVTSLATSRAQLVSLRQRLAKYLKAINDEAASTVKKEADKKG